MATLNSGKRRLHDEPNHDASKRTRVNSPKRRTLQYDDYTVGWICALPIEMTATKAMLDRIHDPLPNKPYDTNAYVLGSIGGHNVVIACLPADHYGNNNAAIVANNMRRSFSSIDKCLLVGIRGGVPEATDIRLGDVVVSSQVVQYDFGKAMPNGQFHRTSFPTRPPQILMTSVSKLQARHNIEGSQIPLILDEMKKRNPRMVGYAHPGIHQLFSSTYHHVGSQPTCDDCDPSKVSHRELRENNNPNIHYGKIASGNQVIKDGERREKLSRELGILCFEMEAAGFMDSFPCLVIRGICDYSDSHKNKKWQQYAAAAAAAYSKELLMEIPTCQPGEAYVENKFPCQAPTTQDQWQHIHDSLTFDQIESRHATIKPALAKTCEWFLDHHDYLSWLNPTKFVEHHGFLWISGKPGAGKSTLMKFAFSRACSEAKSTENSCVASFFFNARGEELETSTLGMYRSLILYILTEFPELHQELNHITLPHNENNQISWDIETLQKILRFIVMNLGQRHLTCFIDALDECDEAEIRAMVEDFENIGELAKENGAKFYICFSSRHYPHIYLEKGLRLTLEDQSGHSEDLKKYVQSKLKTGGGKAAKEVALEILKKSGGVFMWVVLVIDILNKEFNRGRIFAVKTRLEQLPPKLSELFRDILQRDNDNMDDLLLCIQWILYAKRPMACEEFYFALVSGLDPSPENMTEWDQERITAEHMRLYLLSSSKGLAELTKSKKDPKIQFIHESVRDFLLKDNGIRDLWPEYSDNFESLSHDRLKNCCHVYSNIDISHLLPASVSTIPANKVKDLRSTVSKAFPFLQYATTHILHHADAADSIISQEDFVMNRFSFSPWINRRNLFEKFKTGHYTFEATPMYIFADQGCSTLIEIGLRHGLTQGRTKERYQYPLFAALAGGHEAAATVLQRAQDIGVYIKDKFGEDFLLWATQQGHTSIIKVLLSIDGIDINNKNKEGNTLIHIAAINNRGETLKLLLESSHIDPNRRNDFGRTPLSYATSIHTATDTIKLLLSTDSVDPNIMDNTGRTPLSHAASTYKAADIVKLLLSTSCVDPDLRDNTGRTPLSYAAESHSIDIEDMIKPLLSTGRVDPDSEDNAGRTPLSYAISTNKGDNIKSLLTSGRINPN